MISTERQEATIRLPDPSFEGEVSLEQTLLQRRSVRRFSGEPLTPGQLSQLLWAAQGVTGERGFRTAPSAGALYPLETYVILGRARDMEPGVYRYLPGKNSLVRKQDGDKRDLLARAALHQSSVKEASVSILLTGFTDRTAKRYGARARRYVHMEAGHAAQNVCLQAVSLGLGSVVIGAFQDDRVAETMGLEPEETPLYIIPVGP